MDPEKSIVQIFMKIDSKEKFDQAQSNFPHLMMGKNYEKRSRVIYDYFERKDNGENVSKPPLLKRLEKLKLRRTYATVSGELPDIPLESMTNLDSSLDKFPEYKTKPKFPEHYRRARIYFAVRNDWSKMEKELAIEYGVSESTIGNYRRGEKEPRLVSKLRNSEEERIIQEWAKTHHLDEETVERLKHISPTKIEQVIENRLQDTQSNRLIQIEEIEKQIATSLELSSNVVIADIHSLKSNRVSEIVEQLRTNENLRIGIVDEKLYIWKPDSNKDDMLKVWRNVYFYFDIREISKMVDEIGTQLKLEKSKYERAQNLNELLKQMTNTSDALKIDDSKSRIVGEALHFSRDVLSFHTKDLEGIVTKVTGWNGVGGIRNPRFLESKELEIEQARLYSILKSDGWMNRHRTVGYTEKNSDRFDIVEKGLQVWGDIKLTRYYDNTERSYETRFPSPFWEALNFWGFPLGDKMMHNEGLGLDVDKISLEAAKVYLGELIPEDGSFSFDSGFAWSRSVVLKAGTKGDEYGFKSLITTEQADIVKEYGYHDTEKQRKVLLIGRLQELARDSNPNIAFTAKELERIVQSISSRLADDEIKVAHRLSIKTHSTPMVIRYSLRTGRISVYWKIKTTNKVDDAKWAIACPPNDIRKRNIVKTWLKKHESIIDSAKQELEEKGISYDEWWF